ncbi:MAG: tRNA glutamyl-Q(34) synthetase GluQRS [Actinomycetaceae bacterium]|nr:tRNA glutamyl-Q(34) synthetase GluQRS [Actinomycetaceae bacterium]MDY5854125.1 tRNA glutamyl-Q(34) synthetase GluQRS [Arcanobacterium sp.]
MKNVYSGAVGAGRYAPSPSGDLHLGNLRTALLAWAYARSAGLQFVLRMEDLDERSRPQYVDSQLRDLAALGLDWDGPVLRQSQRLERYAEIFEQLVGENLLYECYCTRKELAEVASAPHQPPGSYPGTCRHLSPAQRDARRLKLVGTGRDPAFRLRTGVTALTVVDAHYGEYLGAVDDVVIKRGDGVYSYNFVSVVDDGDSGVTQIVRGDDLLPSTSRQVYLQGLLGYPTPEYRHVPLVLNGRGVRLAKRDGVVTMQQLATFGWQAADIVQLLANSLGYGEVRSAAEFLSVFDPERLTGAHFGAGDECDDVRCPWQVDVAALEAGPRVVLG